MRSIQDNPPVTKLTNGCDERYFIVQDMGYDGIFIKCKSCGWTPEHSLSHVDYRGVYCDLYNINIYDDGKFVCIPLKSNAY